LKIRVEGLPGEADPIWVTFNSTATLGKCDADGVVTVTPPQGLSPGKVDVKIGYQGRWSDIRTLDFG
jgi:hypothetical protein